MNSPADGVSSDSHRLESPHIDLALRVIAAVAVAIGVVARFMPRAGLWLDEALTVNISTLPLGDIAEALRHDGHPPLYYYLLHLWTQLGGTSDWWVRALPALLSVAMIPAMYLCGARLARRLGAGPLGARRTALIAAAVTAVVPFSVRYGTESRMYSLVSLLVAIGYLVVDDLLTARRGGRARVADAVGATAVTAALLWSHYWSLWLLAAVGLLAVGCWFRTDDAERRRGAVTLIGALLAGGVLFLPWLPSMLYQAAHTGTPWGEGFGPVAVVITSLTNFSGGVFGFAQLNSYLFVLLIALGITAKAVRSPATPGQPGTGSQLLVISGRPAPRVLVEGGVVLVTLAIGWLTAVASGGTFSARYASVVYPLFLLLLTAGLSILRRPATTAIVLGLVVALSSYSIVDEIGYERTQADEVATAISADMDRNGADDSVVVACPDQIGVALDRALRAEGVDATADADEATVVVYPAAGDPRFVDWVDYGDRNEASDPQEFLDSNPRLTDEANTIYFVGGFGYKTFDTKCEDLLSLISVDRPMSAEITAEATAHDEPMGLWIARPRG